MAKIQCRRCNEHFENYRELLYHVCPVGKFPVWNTNRIGRNSAESKLKGDYPLWLNKENKKKLKNNKRK